MKRRLGPRQTARLWLEPWSDRHAAALAAANADAEVMRFVGNGAVLSVEDSAAQSARFTDHWNRFGFGLWAVREKANGATVGFAELVFSLIHPDNAASAAVARKLGLSRREQVRNPRSGAPVDVYAIAAPGSG
jgi:RimJ/RimL family protein N-acetyltransferase